MNPILSAHRITKSFPGVTALKDVSFDLRPGEIHAICGENGAGKSTLIKLLSGIHSHGSYEGELRVNGETAKFGSIRDAGHAGIAVIYQELALIEELSVAENIFLGAEPRRNGLIDWARIQRESQVLLEKFNVNLDPLTQCKDLGVGQKQLVEIIKALRKNSGILILDEPTAALSEHEVQILLGILRDLRHRGIACIYISHRLEEVFAIADRITVLRDGATIATHDTAETTKAAIILEMVGREIADLFPRQAREKELPCPGILMRVEGLSVIDPRTGKEVLHDVSFSLAEGEVLGIGGLMGAGRTELLMHLFGAWGIRQAGRVEFEGSELGLATPAQVLRRGIALVSEDRRRYGLFLEESIGFNLSLSALGALAPRGMINTEREFRKSHDAFTTLQVKAPNLEASVGKLSGGNQQKVVLGKALMTEPRVIFLDEPTRGIDVGAKVEIYEIINQLTAAGKGVILVSSELPELLGMSDRIVMLHEGRIGGRFDRANATPEKLMAAALGEQMGPIGPMGHIPQTNHQNQKNDT